MTLPQDADLLTDHQAVQLDRGVPIIRETTGRGTAAQRDGVRGRRRLTSSFDCHGKPR